MPRMTHSELLAYEARCNPLPRLYPATSSKEKERDLHNQVLAECKRRGWIALHGSMAQSTFRTEGEWDFTILADNGRVILAEAKTRTGKLSPAQLALHAWARKLGHIVYVVRSMEEFLNIANGTSDFTPGDDALGEGQ